jgi:hypothetical protein
LARPVGGSDDITTWDRRLVRYLPPEMPTDPVGPAQRYGPRGMVVGRNQAGQARLYVLNRIDNSVAIIDTSLERVRERFTLHNDPTPAHVKAGRHWLYDAQLSSSGYVSCATCHPDGRTDALAWRLGNPTGAGIAFPATPRDQLLRLAGTGTLGVGANGELSDPAFFVTTWWSQKFGSTALLQPEDKREMVTQSLQGLSNWEVDPAARDLFANAPYHWRGDRQTVQDFEEGFVNLLGTPQPSPAQKAQMEQFVLSISYPPNPKQDRTRTYPAGSRVARGLDLFHTQKTVLADRSCSTCHELPDGSNNRLTVLVTDPAIQKFIQFANRQGIESAALRGLFQKEPVWQSSGLDHQTASSTRIGHFGLNHNGIQPATANLDSSGVPQNLTTINSFIDLFFNNNIAQQKTDGEDVKQFVHELDWGIAPIIGWVSHVRQPEWVSFFQPPPGNTFTTMVGQVHEANAGLVVWVQLNAPTPSRRGFRYFPDGSFLEEPTGTVAFSLQQIHALMSNAQDSLTFVAVPLGSERRAASPTGIVTSFPQTTFATAPTFVDLHANTAYASVPQLTGPVPAPAGNKVPMAPPVLPDVEEVFAKTIQLFQQGLLNNPGTSFGLTGLRHEAPRRLRVRGTGIEHGAKLLVGILDPNATPTTDPLTTPRVTVALELHPTAEFSNGQRVWETAAELDPFQLYQLMLGGAKAPGVEHAIVGTVVEQYSLGGFGSNFGSIPALMNAWGPYPSFPAFSGAPQFQANTWNIYPIRVRNPGPNGPADPSGPVSATVWQQLVLGS